MAGDGGPGEAESVALRASAARAFQAWSGRRISRPEQLVRSIDVQYRRIARLVSVIDGRRTTRRSTPTKARSFSPPPTIDGLDLWRITGEELRRRTIHVERCPTCTGKGKASCKRCSGTHRVACRDCGGSGRELSDKTGRPINCRFCRGKTVRACPECSTKGLVTCPECEGDRSVEAWREITEATRIDVQVEPDDAGVSDFEWARDGVDVPADKIAAEALVLATASGVSVGPGSLPAVHQHWAAELWPRLTPKVRSGERVRVQNVTVLDVPVSTIEYQVGARSGRVDMLGTQMQIRPGGDGPIVRHERFVRAARFALGAVFLVVAIAYLSRGDYFIGAATSALLLATAVACTSGAWLVSRASLRRSRLAPSVVGGLALVCAVAAGFAAEPSADRAARLLASNQLDRAEREVRALGEPDSLWNELINRRIVAATSFDRAAAAAAELRPRSALSAPARQRTFELLQAEIVQTIDAGDLDSARKLLQELDAEQAKTPAARDLELRLTAADVRRCITAFDDACTDAGISALDRLGARDEAAKARADRIERHASRARTADTAAASGSDPRDRLAQVTSAVTAWKTWARYSGLPVPDERARGVREERARKDVARLVAEEEKRAAQAEASRKREEAQARRREQQAERTRIQRERAWAPLLCRDGTFSPSCTCGNPRSGCCSHHGGVVGCSADRSDDN